MRGYHASWPYVCYSGFKGYLWLFNAFDQGFIMRFEPPAIEKDDIIDEEVARRDKLRILSTYITDDQQLFVHMISRGAQKYQLWKIDMRQLKVGGEDSRKQRVLSEFVVSYDFETVDH